MKTSTAEVKQSFRDQLHLSDYTCCMALQIFGTRKSSETRKAERFFKERGVSYQFVDLAEKGISRGELRAVSSAVGRNALIDTNGPLFQKKGLAYIEYDPEEEVLKAPLLLRTPIIRNAAKAVIGFDPKAMQALVDG
jgi:arsenate reductase (glutaredoxin)